MLLGLENCPEKWSMHEGCFQVFSYEKINYNVLVELQLNVLSRVLMLG